MTRIILAIAFLIATLAAVVIGRTLMVPAYEAPVGSAPTSKFDPEKIAARLAEAVKFRTISWQPGAPAEDVAASRAAFVAFREWITATYPQFSQTATREIVGDYTLLFTWAGSDPSLKPVLLMSHMDVVPIAPGSEGNWKHPPFAGVIADGYVWGRGTMDVKNGIVGMLEAAETLIASGFRPKRTILFSFGHDEEVGGAEGNAKVAVSLASRKTTLDFVVDEGGVITRGIVPGVSAPVALVGVAEKGYVTLELTAKADGGHSSLPPPVAETAIGRLAQAIGRIGDAPFESRIDGIARDSTTQLMPAMPFVRRMAIANLWLFEPLVVQSIKSSATGGANLHTTIAPTMISGGNKDNVMPPDAKVTINFRIHPRDTIQGVVDHVKQAVGDEKVGVTVKSGAREASPTSDMDGPRFALIKRTLESVMPGVIVAPNLLAAATDSRYFQPMTRNVFRIVPAVMEADDLRGFHGTNERMPVASMRLIADFFSTLIITMDEPSR